MYDLGNFVLSNEHGSLCQVDQSSGASNHPDLNKRIQELEKENVALKKVTDELRALVLSLDSRVKAMEGSKPAPAKAAVAPAPAKPAAKDDDDDDDVDLFGKLVKILITKRQNSISFQYLFRF